MGRLAIVVGIPGVGKTTVMANFVEMCQQKGIKASVLTMGTLMLEEAIARGLAQDRDGLRKLTLKQQRELREASVPKILGAKKEASVVLLDTHFMVRSRGGYLIALPAEFLGSISPEFFVIVETSVEEIVRRRNKDKERTRDVVDRSEVKLEQDITRQSAFLLASLYNADVVRVLNKKNQAAQAAGKLYEFLLEGA
ncbi:MAG TPA: adenylate kinase [Thermoproteota archaeon]|nr:adenylate kinase [Thermoproteota archaeon]